MRKSKPIDNPEHISILLPTRERPEKLRKLLNSLYTTTHKKGLIDVWIYFDNDDDVTRSFSKNDIIEQYDFDIRWISGERTISQGEMVNLLWEQCTTNAGIYFPCIDDYLFVTQNWDDVVRDAFHRYDDRLLLAYPMDPTAGPEQATFNILSGEWINLTGRIYTQYFPFWFDDCWVDQVAQLIQRKCKLPMRMEPQGGKGRTPRMKNLVFWNSFFENTLDERILEAERLRKAIWGEDLSNYEKNLAESEVLVKKFWEDANGTTEAQLIAMENEYSLKGGHNVTKDTFYLICETAALNVLFKKMMIEFHQNRLQESLRIMKNISRASVIKSEEIASVKRWLLKEIAEADERNRNEIHPKESDHTNGGIWEKNLKCSSVPSEKNKDDQGRKTQTEIQSLDHILAPAIESSNGKKKLKILLVYSLHPKFGKITLPEWIKETLRCHFADTVQVFACGPFNEIAIPDGPDFYTRVADVVSSHSVDVLWDIEGGGVSMDFMFKRFPDSITIPKVFWAIDTHQYLPAQIEKSKHFDLVFSAQKNAVANLGPHAHWLPAGAGMHEKDYGFERTIDVGFIGNIFPRAHDRRKKIVEYLSNVIPGFAVFNNVFLEEKAKLASRMKIMVNVSLNNDINFRIFETLACGALLITDKINGNGLEDLFRDGEHLITFDSEKDLVEKIHYYLEHEDERIRIADAGKAKVLECYTHKEIAGKALDLIYAHISEKDKHSAPALPSDLCWCGGKLQDSVHPHYFQCELCGTHVVKQKYSAEELQDFYTLSGYWHEHQTEISGFPAIEDRAKSDFRDRIPHWFQLVEKYSDKQESLLEIGCAHGGFLHYCRERGIEKVVGVEVDEETCMFARDHFQLPHVYSGLFPDVKLPMNSFDIITGFDVIEHFADPIAGITAISNLLSDNGVFVLQTPCFRGEANTWEQFKPLEHLFLYNESSINKLFLKCGLEITDILPGYFPDDMFVIGRKANRRKNIIFLRGDSIGDNVMAASMVPHIKKKYPHTNITVVCQDHIVELYESSPSVSAVIGFDRAKGYQNEAYRNLIVQRLQAVRADVVLSSLYSRDPLYDFFAVNSGARTSIAFNGDLCNIPADVRDRNNRHYTTVIKDNEEHKPELERHRDFLSAIGIDAPPLQPIVWITPDDEKYADAFFSHNPLDPEKTIALFVCGQWAGKFYDHYEPVLSRILKDNGMSVLTLGSVSDWEKNEKLIENLGVKAINLAGKTTLRQTAAIVKRCCLGIGADTGTAHIACAVGTPHVVLLGGGHFGRFLPYSPLTSVVCLPLECYGCNWHCRYGSVHCVKDIGPEVFVAAIRETLLKTSENPRVFIQASSSWNPSLGRPKWESFEKYLDPENVEIISIGNDGAVSKTDGFYLKKDEEIRAGKSKVVTGREPLGADRGIASPERLYETAQKFLERGREKETIEVLNLLLSLYPDFALAHNDLGVLYFRDGDKEKALQHYQKAAQLQPENITFLKNLADFCYVEAGELEAALKIYLKVLVVNPTDIETLLILGAICASLEKNADARVFYNRVLELEPWNLDVREKIAALSRGSGTDGGLQTTEAGEQMPATSRREEQQNMDRGLLPDGAYPEKYLVSAIVSTYNAERFIRGRMENLVNQTLFKKNQLEIIVIDSNSTQKEREIVEAFMGNDNHIVYERTSKRETVYGAWNRGIKAAKGTYVINANTDDRFATDALERMADELGSNPDVSAVYGDWLMTKVENDTFDSHTKKQVYHYPEFFPPLFFYGQITTHAALLRKSIFEEIGFYDEAYKVSGDREFMFRFSAHGLKAKKIPHIVGLYLENQSGIEHSETNSGIMEYTSISEQFISPEYFVRLLGYDSVPDNATLAQLYADIGSMGKGLITTNGTPIVNIVPAEKLLDKALAFDDKNIMALNNSGVVACFKGEKEIAVQMFGCALNVPCQENLRPVIEKNLGLVNRGDAAPDDYAWMKPVSLDYHIWVRDQDSIREKVLEAERLLQEKQYEEAKKIFLEVLKEDPCDAIAHNDLGVLFFQEGNKEKALYHYEQAAELQPENITFQKNLADFHYLVMGRVNEALRIYTKVLAANPKDIESLLIMGHICVSLHKGDDAEIFFKRILEIEPGNKDARQYLDKILGDQGVESNDSKEQQAIERDALLNGADTGNFLISAIVSTYNAERFIRGCLEDLEAQTIADKLEIIVVDSGSEQNEKIIVKEFQKKYTNIKYIRTEQRETVYAAWNHGIRAAAGKYITNANSDDRHRKNALEKMVDVLEQRPDIALVYANVIKTENENETLDDFTPSGTYCWKDFDPKTLADGCYIGPQPMWRKDVHREYGYFDETFHSAGDWEFWLRISQNETFLHLNEFLGLYLESPTSVGHRDPELLKKELMRIRWQYGPLKPQSTKVAEKMYQEAQSLVNGGMKKEAIAALLELLNVYPDFAMAHNDLGVLYSNENDEDNTLNQYRRAVELEPENPIFTKNLADFYYVKLGRTEEALALYVKLLASDPMDVEILTALAHISIGLEKYDHAEIFVSRMLEADPWNQNAKKILDGLTKRQAMGSVDQEMEAIGRKEAGSRVSLAEKIY